MTEETGRGGQDAVSGASPGRAGLRPLAGEPGLGVRVLEDRLEPLLLDLRID